MDIREQERHEEKDNNHKELRIFDWTSPDKSGQVWTSLDKSGQVWDF